MKYLYELIKKYSFKSVWERLIKFYPEEVKSEKKYRKVYDLLKKTDVKKKYKKRFIVVEYIRKNSFNDEGYTNVGATINGEHYSMSFMNWSELLGYRIMKQKRYSDIQTVAYWLWEATFYGFTQKQVDKVAQEVVGRIKEVKKLGNATR